MPARQITDATPPALLPCRSCGGSVWLSEFAHDDLEGGWYCYMQVLHVKHSCATGMKREINGRTDAEFHPKLDAARTELVAIWNQWNRRVKDRPLDTGALSAAQDDLVDAWVDAVADLNSRLARALYATIRQIRDLSPLNQRIINDQIVDLEAEATQFTAADVDTLTAHEDAMDARRAGLPVTRNTTTRPQAAPTEEATNG
jgi:hypothetical protein